ncbi:hypothetical protein [Haloarcula sp. H-GB5]|jgi:hypothetical protein
MEVPEYLQIVLEEAENRLAASEKSPSTIASRIAEEHDELTSPLRGENRFDNLIVLKDIRDIHGICADELEPYRVTSPSTGSWGEATVEAVVRRSLEDLIYTHLSDEQSRFI